MAPPLRNYLRTHRKRADLSQRDVAYLLGVKSGAKISRYERLSREPGLRAALAYEAVFRVPTRVLFAGLYTCAERRVRRRARTLLRRSEKTDHHPRRRRRVEALAAIARKEGRERGRP
jgi:transcriptional regulator with XRE-family HTH domain